MICRPRALNEKKSDGEQLRSTNGAPEEESRHVASIEAQEAKALQEYSEAVSWIAQGRMEEAEAKLQKLWHSELIQTSAGKKSAGFSRSILKLRRAIEKNLAPFLSKSGRHSEAIDFYINVCEHEPDNFMAWYSLGIEGWKAFNFVIAREAFLYARALNSDNFSCPEHLASTFFVLGDHGNCLQILAEMLKRKPSSYLRAVSEHLFPSPGSSYSIEYRQQVVAPLDAIAKKLRRDSVSLELDAIVPPDPRNVLTLVDLGDALLSTYEWIKEQPMVRLPYVVIRAQRLLKA
uniref:TPR_REGION domain-containing protein n=1 Tax=Trichuris muris TaxID=70415 RepID=A0A5S6Q2A3_TRIMR